MSNRRQNTQNPLLQSSEKHISLGEMDGASYGLIRDVDLGTQIVTAIDLGLIDPDAAQPRKQIPSVIRREWDGREIRELFGLWIAAVEQESHLKFNDLVGFIQMVIAAEEVLPPEAYNEETGQPIWRLSTIGKALMAVVELAAEIRRDGLTNPITVIRAGDRYRIDTGERRWLAYHLLNITYGGAEWKRIPAKEEKKASVWRQASENTARRQLTAVGMARQLAILIMDLYRQNHPDVDEGLFLGYEYFSHDLDYYAQVADGNKWRIPRGRGEQLLNAMGLRDPGQLRKYRMLLNLPNEVWEVADDLNWSLDTMIDMILHAVNPDQLLLMAARKAEMEGYTVPFGTVSESTEGEPTPESPAESTPATSSSPDPQDDEFQTETQEREAANDTEAALGGRGAPVKMESGQIGTLSHVVGGIVYVNTANGVRQYKRENVSRADAPAPANPRPTITDPPPNPTPTLPTQTRLPLSDPHSGGAATGTPTPTQPSPAEIDRRERVAMKPISEALAQFKFSVERAKTSPLTLAANRNQMGNLLREARRVIDHLEEEFLR